MVVMGSTNKNQALSGAYLAKADNAIASLTGEAQAAVLGAGAAGIRAADAAAASAGHASNQLNQTAGQMRGIADSMLPSAGRIEGDAATLRQAGADSRALAQPWIRQSQGLLAMDEGAGGLSGEFATLYRKLDPTLQMAQAAADARGESEAQTNAAVRALQRAGVSPTASALATIRQRAMDRSTALVASVKTKARQAGISLQMDALQQGLTMALQQAGVGESFMRDAASNIASASQAEQGAAAIRQGAASIYGASGNLVADAQNLIQQAANGQISANSAQVQAHTALVNAFTTAAEYYATQASSFRGLAQEGAGSNSNRLI